MLRDSNGHGDFMIIVSDICNLVINPKKYYRQYIVIFIAQIVYAIVFIRLLNPSTQLNGIIILWTISVPYLIGATMEYWRINNKKHYSATVNYWWDESDLAKYQIWNLCIVMGIFGGLIFALVGTFISAFV